MLIGRFELSSRYSCGKVREGVRWVSGEEEPIDAAKRDREDGIRFM